MMAECPKQGNCTVTVGDGSAVTAGATANRYVEDDLRVSARRPSYPGIAD